MPKFDMNLQFSRYMLSDATQRVRAYDPKQPLTGKLGPGLTKCGHDQYAFELPVNGQPNFIVYVDGSNAYEARANGWNAYLRSKDAKAYRIFEEN
jgi:hypothetical protein